MIRYSIPCFIFVVLDSSVEKYPERLIHIENRRNMAK